MPAFRQFALRESRLAALAAIAAALSAQMAPGSPHSSAGWQAAIAGAARHAPEARILVVDVATGRLLAANHLSESTRTLAAPGSTLKPFILYGLIKKGLWNPDRRVACDRNLSVAGHRMACSHPPAPPFDAQEALAWSCNSYFARVAQAVEPGTLGSLLRSSGLLGATGLAGQDASREATAEFHEPADAERMQLAVLGVEGVRVTPLELAAAYRWLTQELAAHADSPAARVVYAGLEDSARFGMAHPASLGGVPVAGKTGTAEGIASSQTHGWFAGLAPAEKPQVVVVVYLPAGRGMDAARVAAQLLELAPLGRP